MRRILFALMLVSLPFASVAAEKAKPDAPSFPSTPFVVNVKWLDEKNHILPDHAFCVGAGKSEGHGRNISPEISWTKGPDGTKSYALIMHDPDVPLDFTDAGKEGVEIDARAPRQPFYHWVLANIPASITALPMGAEGEGVKKDKLKPGKGKYGTRGLNDYTRFMKDDKALSGIYAGYDGPCPPFNDARVHRYIFTIYALDTASIELAKEYTAPELIQAMQGHVLATAKVTGLYTRNPRLMGN